MAQKRKSTAKKTPASKMTCDKLMDLFLKKRMELPYAKGKDASTYRGWVSDFHIHRIDQSENMALDLRNEADLFLLFVLAVAWSRSGQWENSAFFVSYLKLVKLLKKIAQIRSWVETELNGDLNDLSKLSKSYVEEETKTLCLDSGIPTSNGARRKISLRHDTLQSILVLMKEWASIKKALNESNAKGDYRVFIDKMRFIRGLGPTKNGQPSRMSMKILLILRELRIQRIYNNIPGELCCVPDARVKKAARNISDLKLKTSSDFESHVKNSETIYHKFGDWYDVPLFAYEDLKL